MIILQEGGFVTEVYVDVVLLINFIMDFFILWAAGKMTALQVRRFRLVIGALIGAVYSLVIFLPQASMLTLMIFKIIWSILMILAAFAPLTVKKLFKCFIYMYIISFAMGGAAFASQYFMAQTTDVIQVINGAGIIYNNFQYSMLAPALIMAVILGTGGIKYIRKNVEIKNYVYQIYIYYKEQKIELKALMDTGNQLVDPLTNKPVIVVEAEALKEILPKEILNTLNNEEETIIPDLSAKLDLEWSSRLRLIPFNSVGKRYGVMLGFRPDALEIIDKNLSIDGNQVVLGLLHRALTSEGKYQALLNPGIFDQI